MYPVARFHTIPVFMNEEPITTATNDSECDIESPLLQNEQCFLLLF